MVSELHPTKRIDDAIEALKMLPKDVLLVVLGEGQERPRLEAKIKATGLEDRVILKGFVADAPNYLFAFDIFLHASRSEALAFAVLEAGCASLPVVATRVGGLPEIIRSDQDGILVSPYAPAEIADALSFLIHNPDRAARLGASLHDRVLHDFSVDTMLQKTLALYVP
jgi:glycosyltransferase involved in cell wall biosynthesis